MKKITPFLKKKFWRRKLPFGVGLIYPQCGTLTNYQYDECGVGNSDWLLLTQDSFLAEYYPSAHSINGKYLSRRPIYECVGTVTKDGKEKQKWVLKGYEDVVCISLGLQQRIAKDKGCYFAGKGPWIANETANSELFQTFCSWRDSAGFNTAYLEVALSCLKTGDGAIYWYVADGKIEYEVFSYLKGDILYPNITEDGKPCTYRQYSLNGKEAVDIYSPDGVETWAKYDPNLDADKDWLDQIKGLLKDRKGDMERSEDGYVRIAQKGTQLDGTLNQLTYFRVSDVAWGAGQDAITDLEKIVSYAGEEVQYSAMPTLFLKATKIVSLPNVGHGKAIGVKGSTDDLAHSDAKYLQKQDASNIYTLTIDTLWNNVKRSTSSSFIEVQDLKSGNDSSATIKLMFAPEIQWCEALFVEFRKPLVDMVEVFKQMVGKVEGNITDYANLRVSCGLELNLPFNDAERIDNITKLVYAGILSQENARSEYGNQYINDVEVTKKEKEEDLYMKTFMPLKAKADAQEQFGITETGSTDEANKDDGDSKQAEESRKAQQPQIDNNSQRKNIASGK